MCIFLETCSFFLSFSLLAHTYSQYSLIILFIIRSIAMPPNISNLSLLSFLPVWLKINQFVDFFFKEKNFYCIDFTFSILYFICFHSNLYYFLPSPFLKFSLLLFVYFLNQGRQDFVLKTFLFFHIVLYSYKFSIKHHFCCITEALENYIFIFILPSFLIFLMTSSQTHWLFRSSLFNFHAFVNLSNFLLY